AIDEAEQALTAPAARRHGFVAQCRLLLGQIRAADTTASTALAAAGTDGDAYGTAYGLYLKAWVRLMQRRLTDGVALAEPALVAMGDLDIRPEMPMAPHLVRGFCLLGMDRATAADEAFDRGLRQSERGGYAFVSWYQMGRARVRFLDGRWDDALAEIEGGLDAVEPFGMAEGLHSQAALIAMHRGDFTRYADLVARPDTGLAGRYWAFLRLVVTALAHEHDGQPAQALRTLLDTWHAAVDQGPWFYELDSICPDIARLALATGATADVRPVADALERLAGAGTNTGVGAASAAATLCRGAAERDGALLLAAAEAYRDLGRPLDEGYAYESAAIGFILGARQAEARDALYSALDRYERLDAAWDVERAEAQLRHAGVRRRRVQRRPRTGWESLTATERRVAAMVAAGRTNPDISTELFLSRRTVQSHVSHILAKLGLASRVELAVAAYDRELDP